MFGLQTVHNGSIVRHPMQLDMSLQGWQDGAALLSYDVRDVDVFRK